jgi:hypothetical protein
MLVCVKVHRLFSISQLALEKVGICSVQGSATQC